MSKRIPAAALGIFFLLIGCTTNEVPVIDLPAHRPPSDERAEASFQERLGETSITVFPAVVQTFQGASYDEIPQTMLADFFSTENLATTVDSGEHVDLSTTTARTQHEHFTENIAAFSNYLKANPVTTEYALVAEFLVSPRKTGGEAVGGIQCYVLDAKGNNAFSFLINSHHRLFNEADLKTPTDSDDARAHLVRESTQVLLESLRRQLQPE
jgi:hypothetical protein